MNSVYVSGNVMLALKSAVKLKSNSVTFGFANNLIAVAVEDVIGQLALFPDEESTHESFVIRLPKEIMSEVMTVGYLRTTAISPQVLGISIYKDRECSRLVKHSEVPQSCSKDFYYLYEQIDPKNLTELGIGREVFNKDLLALTTITNESVVFNKGFMSIQGKGIMFHRKVTNDLVMTIPAEVFKYITKSINPNTMFYRNNQNTFLMSNGSIYTIWRSEYKTGGVDMSVVQGAEPLARYSVVIPETLTCGLSSTTALKGSQVKFNLLSEEMSIVTDKFSTVTNIKAGLISGEEIKSFTLSTSLAKLISSSEAVEIAIFYKFIRIKFSDGFLDIGGVIDV